MKDNAEHSYSDKEREQMNKEEEEKSEFIFVSYVNEVRWCKVWRRKVE